MTHTVSLLHSFAKQLGWSQFFFPILSSVMLYIIFLFSLCKKKTNTEKHLKTMLSLFRFFIQFPKQKHNHQPGISFVEKKAYSFPNKQQHTAKFTEKKRVFD
jgi:hypothetical protein